jgi:glutathione S-transferase
VLVLCGFAISNYYNKVKLALLEKGIPFTEELVGSGLRDEAVLSATPLGKIPFIRTEHGPLCESSAIVEYLEARWPDPPLLPRDPWAAAKVRELCVFTDLHLELVARELYLKAFFGGEISESHAARVRKQLEKNIVAYRRLAKFAPFVAGDTFTLADCCAWPSLPVVSMATKAVYGEDLLAAGGIDLKPYLRQMGERPSAQRVTADRKAAQALATAKG